MKYTFFLIGLFITSLSFSQNLQLIDTTDYEKRKRLVTQFETKYEHFNKGLKVSYKGAMRKQVQGFYKESQASFLEIIKNKKLLFEKDFQSYVDSLALVLKSNNVLLNDEAVNLYLAKNPMPNAFSIGDGTLILNIGLFSFLENEHQLLSVISHEVAHQVLEHTKESIEKRAEINTTVLSRNSYESRSITAKKYKRGTRSFNLLKDLLYAEGEERRQQEIEADSLGYILYKNTNAPKSEFVNSLRLLQKYDSVPSITVDSLIYRKLFDLPTLAFNNKWLKQEDFNDYNYNHYKSKIDRDSLKDHPEIEQRIAKLQASFSELKEASPGKPTDSTFYKLQGIARQASVENLYLLNEYGLSTYLILKRLEDNIDNSYYRNWLGVNFKAIYDAKKNYRLNRYIDRLAPNEQSESYQNFLSFMWNLKLDEIEKIADYYLP
ncbi:M48 family metalloprotease [Seonamhaeicola sp.]|uniref:M48 family metalloprotease n=1 Tax=Seonamhaeicola sp. TaxID=1912245 RepID=UPI002614B9BA|nr:M48 family metalloprotease [Seonamhaeicola sp.]